MSLASKFSETGRHTLVFGMGSFLSQGISFLLLPVYTNYLSVDDYGVVNLLMIAGSLVYLLSASIIGPALFRSYYDYDTEQGRGMVTSTAFRFALACSLLLFAAGFLTRRSLSGLLTGDPAHGDLTAIILFTSVVQSVNTVAMAVFRARKWSVRFAAVSLSGMLVSMGVSIYLVVCAGRGIFGVIAGQLSGQLVSAMAAVFMIRDQLRGGFSRAEAGRMLRYGLPFVPENSLAFVVETGTRMVLQYVLGSASVGLYALGNRLGHLVQALMISPFSMIAPASIFSAEKDGDAHLFYSRLLTYYLLFTGWAWLVVSALSPDVLRLMSKPEFREAWRPVPWIAAAVIAYGMRGLVSIGLALKRRTSWFSLAFALGSALNLALLMFLVPEHGPAGAGMALLAGNLLICLVRFRASQRIYPIGFELSRIARIVLVFGASYAVSALVRIESPGASLAIRATISVALAPLLLAATRFFLPGEWRRLAELRERIGKLLARRGPQSGEGVSGGV